MFYTEIFCAMLTIDKVNTQIFHRFSWIQRLLRETRAQDLPKKKLSTSRGHIPYSAMLNNQYYPIRELDHY
jgi:hypothetical protein